MKIDFLYIARGKLHLKLDGAPFRIVDSEFGKATQERVLQIQRRNIFRDRGMMANRIPEPMLKQMEERANTATPINFTSACCDNLGKVYYAIQIGEVAGIFTLDSDRIVEKRLYHGSDFLIRYLDVNSSEGTIACAAEHQDGTANIATMPVMGAKPHEITEGDSLDLAPSWIRHKPKALVYQSAGIARNREGYAFDRSPFRIEELDFKSQAITCLAEDPNYDFLEPKMTEDGKLYYIRRPYKPRKEQIDIWTILKDLLLLPLRLANTFYQILNFFAVTFTGKPLMKVGEAKPENNQQELKIWGELIDLHKLSKEKNHKEDKHSGLVPKSWQLIARTTDGIETEVANGVLYYDLAADGSILYTNGNRVYCLANNNNTPEQVLDGEFIEQLALLNIEH